MPPIIDLDEVYDYSSNPLGESRLERHAIKLFNQIPLEARVNYTQKPYWINEEDQIKFLKFFLHLGMIGHKGQKRKHSGKPYYDHEWQAVQSQARFGKVSFIALAPTSIHDVIEEAESEVLGIRAEDIKTKKDAEEYRLKSNALFLGIGMMSHQFFIKNLKFPDRFYFPLYCVMKVLNNITRRLDETYFENLHKIFYGNKNEDEDWAAMVEKEDRVWGYVGEFFDIKNRQLFRDYLFDVHFMNTSGYGKKDELMEKNRRRTIMTDNADSYANVHDFRNVPMNRRAKQLVKALIMINETRRLYAGKFKEESKATLNRILNQCQRLEIELARQHGVVDRTLVEITPNLAQEYIEQIDDEIHKYIHTPLFASRTTPDEDPSRFAGTLDKCIGVLMKWEDEIFAEDNYMDQYAFFRNMQEQFKAFRRDRTYYIHGLATKLQRELPADGYQEGIR